ncbi:MAG: hypothetical protein ACAI25_04475 [Planctomycetota bacterium]
MTLTRCWFVLAMASLLGGCASDRTYVVSGPVAKERPGDPAGTSRHQFTFDVAGDHRLVLWLAYPDGDEVEGVRLRSSTACADQSMQRRVVVDLVDEPHPDARELRRVRLVFDPGESSCVPSGDAHFLSPVAPVVAEETAHAERTVPFDKSVSLARLSGGEQIMAKVD